jgi:hypothetical protein
MALITKKVLFATFLFSFFMTTVRSEECSSKSVILFCQQPSLLVSTYEFAKNMWSIYNTGATPGNMSVIHMANCAFLANSTKVQLMQRKNFNLPNGSAKIAEVNFNSPVSHTEDNYSIDGEYIGKKQIIYSSGWVAQRDLICPIVKPDKTVASLIEKEAMYNDKCRGGPGDTQEHANATQKICSIRDQIFKQIEAKGWCYGLPDQPMYQKEWIPCLKETNAGPSFNCSKAASNVERLICGDADVSSLDRKMVAAYKSAMILSPNESDKIKSEGTRWRATIRDKCNSVDCLRSAYTTRIEAMHMYP